MYKELEEGIKKALGELGLPEVAFSLEHPKDLSHGDYMTNVALVAFEGRRAFEKAIDGDSETVNVKYGVEFTNPLKLAEALVLKLKNKEIAGVENIEKAGPGFINFTLKRDVFLKSLIDAQDKEWGNTEVYKGKKILVEHSSPNLFKPFHIGHLMNNTIGEALYRLAKSSGAQATPISFPSDISLGVAKAIFILLEELIEEDMITSVSILGDAYVKGTKRFEEDETIHARVKEIADNLYAGKDSPEWKLFKYCKGVNIKYFEDVVAKLGSNFDSYIYESEAGVDGKKIVLENTPKVFTESEDAVVYTPEGNRLHTSVFINSQGNPTYEAKDIGLIDLKFKKYNPDLSIFVTDSQQISHFLVVLDAAGKINKEWEERVEKSLHRYHGRMSFNGQKMSSRLGNVPLAEDVISSVTEEAIEVSKKRIVPYSSGSSKQLEQHRNTPGTVALSSEMAEKISIAAIKFTILRTKAGLNINFDPETSLSFEGDSGPYLQYTAVRAGSLLQKGKDAGISPNINTPVVGTETLERLVARFIEVISRAQVEWAPHYIVTYLSELAQEFNSWYGQGKIIDEDRDATAYRLSVVSATRQTLINGLWVLGIEVPENM